MNRLFALLLVLALCTASTSSASDGERRIVALAPHIVEILFAVGAGPQVVGAVDYSDYPAAAKELPRVGGYRSVSMEGILRLEPTLVIAMDDFVRGLTRLREFGVAVEYSYPSSVEGVLEDIDRVGRWTGRQTAARALVRSLRMRLRDIAARRPTSPIPVFYEIWPAPLRTAGGPSFISDTLDRIGARNVFAHVPLDAPRVSREAVLEAAPDVIIVPGEARSVAERTAEWRSLFAEDPSLRIIEADHDLLHRPGPRLIDGMEKLQARLLARPASQDAR